MQTFCRASHPSHFVPFLKLKYRFKQGYPFFENIRYRIPIAPIMMIIKVKIVGFKRIIITHNISPKKPIIKDNNA